MKEDPLLSVKSGSTERDFGYFVFPLVILLAISLMWVGYVFSTIYHNSQFRVIYSLEKREHNKEIIKLIDEADRYIYFAIYFFTRDDIAEALIRAKVRGVEVKGLTDFKASTESNKNIIDKLGRAGIRLAVSKNREGLMHLKTIVTDKAYASGSFNWTKSATVANDEILEISTNRGTHDKYLKLIRRLLADNDA